MSAETLARWQFGITTVYHFFFVPITLGLSILVAVLQTLWVRTGNDMYLRLTKFYGKLFLINFAMGVVTGIVQEFQFGMNWSEYSRFVGDVFGAPLALEALLAFFLESTFLGLWIFGWDKLPQRLHLATIWLAGIGTNLSAIFILAANSWMQNPVGAVFRNGRAELDNFAALLVNPVFLTAFPHVMTAAWLTVGAFVAAIAGWHLVRTATDSPDHAAYRFAVKLGAWIMIVAGVLVAASGDFQGKVMTNVQPMKMAAAEALYEGESNGAFSILTIGTLDGSQEVWALKVPGLLSFLAGREYVAGINDLRDEYAQKGFMQSDGQQNALQQQYAPELKKMDVDPVPNIPVAYWSFRLMMGMGFVAMAIGAFLLWLLRKGNTPQDARWWTPLMIATPLLPLFAISIGWIFTEMGRQPWIVAGVLPTASAVSPTVSAASVAFSMIVYTLVYGVLAVIEVRLLLTYIQKGLPDVAPVTVSEDEDAPLSFAY